MPYREGSGDVEDSGDKPAVMLIHGSWSGAWAFDFLRKELEEKGYPVETKDLPLDDKELTYHDFGAIVLSTMLESGHEKWVGVGHSSGANTLLWLAHLAERRIVGKVALEKMIYISPSPVEDMLGYVTREPNDPMPDQYAAMAKIGGLDHNGGVEPVDFDRQTARWSFFNDCDDETANWALERLRPQFRYRAFSELPYLPKMPAHCLITTNDWTLQEDWQKYVADRWLGIGNQRGDRGFISSGHFPMISMPKETASWIDYFITRPTT